MLPAFARGVIPHDAAAMGVPQSQMMRSLRGARWRRRFLRKATLLSLPKDGGADAAFDKPEGNVPEGDARLAKVQAAVRGLRELQKDIGKRKGFKPLTDKEIKDAINEGRP